MKEILDIYKASKNPEFIASQFSDVHPDKNVLFIQPQLNGRHFYKYILPYITMFEFGIWGTAITDMDKYKPNKEYEPITSPLNSKQILWADYIVFPFVTQSLDEVYDKIRMINPNIKIVYNVDFNYYKLSKKHPLYEQFSPQEIIETIEDNIFYSDITLVTNTKLSDFLIDKFAKELSEQRYKDLYSNVQIGTFPTLIDDVLVMENIEVDVPDITKEQEKEFRVGIIATNYTWEDIASYKELFSEVKEKLGDEVKFVLIGFDGIDNKTQKSCFPDGLEFEQVKPCTIVHYFKQLRKLHLDLIFIPLRQNEFNITSENYNKFIEGAMFKIPVMVYDIYPYNEIISNGKNGVILKKKKEFLERIEFFNKNRDELKRIGESAHDFVYKNFVYSDDNLQIINQIYGGGKIEEGEGKEEEENEKS
jgi:glycosyltransferase involved in cell wall biosynthesis